MTISFNNVECKESAAPAAKDGTYKRVCDPTGDKAAKCTYTCEQDDSVKTEATCDAETGKWSLNEVSLSCPCGDAPAAPDGTTASPADVKKPAKADTEVTYTCPISGKTVKTKCDGTTGKWSVEKPELKCIGIYEIVGR